MSNEKVQPREKSCAPWRSWNVDGLRPVAPWFELPPGNPRRDDDEAEKACARILQEFLRVAVPIRIEESRHLTADERVAMAHSLVDVVSCKFDAIVRASKTKGEASEVFQSIAQGLAMLAFCPGGVTFLGVHFQADA